MFEQFLDIIIENPVMASIVIVLSALLLFFVCVKPLVLKIAEKTKTKKDDEITQALYKAIEEHKEEVEAIHKAAKKASEKKCKKS